MTGFKQKFKHLNGQVIPGPCQPVLGFYDYFLDVTLLREDTRAGE